MVLIFQSLEVEQTRKMEGNRGLFFIFFIFYFLFFIFYFLFLFHVFVVMYKKQHGVLAIAETKL